MKDLSIILSGPDARSVDMAARLILDTARLTGNEVRGPIPIPIPAGPAAERTIRARRRMDIVAPNPRMMPELQLLGLPTTVEVAFGL